MEALGDLSKDLRELCYAPSIDRITPPSALEFYREYVAPNKPCIIEGGLEHWPALSTWTDANLAERLAGQQVTVDMTPNGRADAVLDVEGQQPLFVTPYKQQMSFGEFVTLFRDSRSASPPVVPYLQHQNSNLTEELSALIQDVEPHIPWATEALGVMPEAVNLWIGDDRSETSFHKDHYDNLYAVISGSKTFTLLPPAEVYRMHLQRCRLAEYVRGADGTLRAAPVEPPAEVLWCPVEPYPTDPAKAEARFPNYFGGPAPWRCTVKKGELLYLPSCWFHYVQQTPDESGRVIAVNYWYDMRFDDVKYAYFKHVADMATRLGCCEPGPE